MGLNVILQTTKRGKTLIASLPTCTSTCHSFLPRQCLHIFRTHYDNKLIIIYNQFVFIFNIYLFILWNIFKRCQRIVATFIFFSLQLACFVFFYNKLGFDYPSTCILRTIIYISIYVFNVEFGFTSLEILLVNYKVTNSFCFWKLWKSFHLVHWILYI